MSAFAILFWLWLIVSTAIFIQRRVKAHRAKASAIGRPAATVDGASRSPAMTPPWVAPPPEDEQEPATPVAATSPAPTTPQTSGPAPTTNHDGRPSIPSVADQTKPTGGIAEALVGITMPCDLAPLTLGTSILDPDHVDLVTTGVGPADVSEGLTKELERLGYTVRDLGAGEHMAERDGTVVRVKVHDRPRLSVSSDGRGFTTAPPDGIVVEMSVV